MSTSIRHQYNNEANWRAHYEGTGKEILAQTGGRVTHSWPGSGRAEPSWALAGGFASTRMSATERSPWFRSSRIHRCTVSRV